MNEFAHGLSEAEMGVPTPEAGQESDARAAVGRKEFDTEGGKVAVEWKTFTPEGVPQIEGQEPPDRVVLFLPGVGIEAQSGTAAGLSQHLANYEQVPAIVMTSRKEEVNVGEQDDLLHQAEAIRQLVVEKGITELTLVGNSLGGAKSIDLAYLIQTQHPNITIKGMILLGSAGLYEQDSTQIAQKLVKESGWETTKTVTKELAGEVKRVLLTDIQKLVSRWDVKEVLQSSAKAIRSGVNVVEAYRKELFGSSLKQFAERIQQEAVSAARLNERAKVLKMPIVLVQGTKDTVFEVDQIIPAESKVRGMDAQQQRSEAVRQNVFLESENIIVLLAEKFGHHGVPYFRDEQIAKVALYMQERERRRKGSNATDNN
ncbi:MAG: alpha/beta hydrolase [Patescibacteria group bacterium]